MVPTPPAFTRLIDVTLPVAPWTPVWPGDPEVVLTPEARIDAGAAYNLSRLSLSTHTGTHVDAPLHLFSGAAGLDAVGLERLVGAVTVFDFPYDRPIGASDLEPLELHERVLFRTLNSARWGAFETYRGEGQPPFPPGNEFVAFTEAAAALLVARGVRTLGIDALSVDLFEREDLPVHRRLLGAGVAVIEGLNLRQVQPGPWFMACLPLNLIDADGGPARVVLMR